MKTYRYTLDSLPQVAESLVPYLAGKGVVAIYGGMGVGKTTLVKALCAALEVKDLIDSPTFSLVNEYRRADGGVIYHFDFYRINRIEEAYDFGYEEYFYSGRLCMVEWPEKIEELLPEDTLRIYITEVENGVREVTVS